MGKRNIMTDKKYSLKKEISAFDRQVEERIKHGFVPDLRRLKKVNWFYNNVWRDPEFVKINIMPKINFILDIAKKRGGKVIELGCGYGYLTLELAREGLDVVGVDVSPKSIEIAKKFAKINPFKKNFGSLEYVCDDVFSMELGENRFDSIIFFGSLHHLPDINSILLKAYKALEQGGNLIAIEPVRKNFTMQSAEFAAILRAILPTWIPRNKKLKDLNNSAQWEKYVQDIFNEYTYKGEHKQSPYDNAIDSEKVMLETIKKYFKIKKVERADAFIDKLIGGLRSKDKYLIAKFLKFLDDYMVQKKIFPATSIKIHAVKN